MKRLSLCMLMFAVVACLAGPLAAQEDAPEMRKPRIDVVFVLDTTGSMSGLIEGAKAKIWSIVNGMVKTDPAPDIRVGLVGYRDRGDAYVTKITKLTDDLDAVYADLMAYGAGGGGDTPESVNQALNEAVTKMDWTEGEKVYKTIFLVGDAPPHMDYEQDVPYADSTKQAITNGIVVNTIQCGNMGATQKIWREIARKGEGEYFQVQQDGGAVLVETPFDEKLAELSRKLGKTRVYYGDAGVRREMAERDEKSEEMLAEAHAAAKADRAGFLAGEAGKSALGRGRDLVTALENGSVDLDEVDEDDLPEKLQEMTPEERTEYIEKVKAERAELRKQIAELSKKRTAFIKKEMEKRAEEGKEAGFDALVLDAAREQAEKRGIEYKDTE
jgi:Mg-chelatase subunit ChlD